MFPAKLIASLLLCFLLLIPIYSESDKTEEDYSPAPLRERPLLNELPPLEKPEIGLAVSSSLALTGLGFTLANAYLSVEEGIEDTGSAEFQKRLFKTGSFMIGTAITTVLIDYFLDEMKRSKELTSEE